MGLGFVAGGGLGNRRSRSDGVTRKRAGTVLTAADVEMSSLNLTPALEKMVSSLKMFPDSKVRYQQLLHYATTLGPMEPELKTEANKVPGCLSTVFVHATMNPDTRKVYFKGDSDAQLTKGLVSMLVNGLSGSTALQIEKVNPEFIKASGLTVSLTPGRNNGFINMLKLMKHKAELLDEEAAGLGPRSKGHTNDDCVEFEVPGKPRATAIGRALLQLNPTELEVEDFSESHKGHAHAGDETHIRIKVVSDAFQDMSLVLRHKVIYTLLDSFMDKGDGGVHALQIDTKAPGE
ncbi:hypothetical protein NDN08_001337 [Rhodosorus marinus]|uniref:Fe-S metabolism associated domain-containing protein n=1 Tax=Rhodosorus marinus TaxID=101924 RepID=A0AAV8UUR1_9RHOD|nr:hypothetical protein NDN08_001337 [Rhodosorus marinus]